MTMINASKNRAAHALGQTGGHRCPNCRSAISAPARVSRHEPDDDCPERHEHCADCQRLVSIGDWDAPPIKTLSMRVSRRVAAQLGRRGGQARAKAMDSAARIASAKHAADRRWEQERAARSAKELKP